MKKLLGGSLVGVILGMLIVVACAPKPSLPSPAAPLTTAPVASQAPIASPKAEDEAWAKVVETAKREGRVNAYATTWVGDVGLAVSKAFKDRYGINVDIVTGRGPEFGERIKAERRMGQIVADIVEGGSAQVGVIASEGLLDTRGHILPVLREKGIWVIEPMTIYSEKKPQIMYRVVEQFSYINTRLVKAQEAPNSWKDLLDPKWRGKMTLKDPKVDSNFYNLIVSFMGTNIWDEDYLKALFKQDIRFVKSAFDDFRMLSSGESYLAITEPDAGAAPYIVEGSPIQAIAMREGMTVGASTLGAVKGGPHPNASVLLLNWLLEKEGQTVYATARANHMIRNDVPDLRPPGSWAKVANPIMLTPEYSDRAVELFREKWLNKLLGW